MGDVAVASLIVTTSPTPAPAAIELVEHCPSDLLVPGDLQLRER